MGWLLDLVKDNELDTLGALASAMLEQWPRGRREVSADGLRSALSKADRGANLAWFEKEQWRGELVDRVLGVSKGTTLARDRAQRRRPSAHDGLVLHDLGTNPIELAGALLPPGLPPILSAPSNWEDEWWYAPSELERRIAASWLRANGLADVIIAKRPEDAQAALEGLRGRAHRPLFLDIASTAGRWDERRRDIASPLFVAGERFPPGGAPFRRGNLGSRLATDLAGYFGDGLWRLQTSTVAESSSAITQWLLNQVGADLEIERLTQWLGERVMHANHRQDLAYVVSVVACAVHFGVARLEKLERARDWLNLFLVHRLRAAGVTQASLSEGLVEQLLRGARRLIEDGDDMASPRSREAWREVLSNHQFPVPADATKFFDTMRRHAKPVEARLQKQILREATDPTASLEALERASLLTGGQQQSTLAPSWLADSLRDLALDAIAADAPRAWGKAVLAAREPGPFARAVARRIEADPRVIEQVTSVPDEDDPAYAAVLELSFRAAGMHALAGQIPRPLLRRLWDRQIPLSVKGWRGQWQASISYADPDEYLLTDGAWFAAALQIARMLETTDGPIAWSSLRADDEALLTALDAIDDALKTPSLDLHPALVPALFELGSDIVAHTQPLAGAQFSSLPRELVAPALLVRAAIHRALTAEDLSLLDRERCGPDRVREECERRGLPFADFCERVWEGWLASGALSTRVQSVGLETPWTRELWAHVPRRVMSGAAVEMVKAALARRHAVPFQIFTSDAWSGLLDAYPDKPNTLSLDRYEAIFDAMPEKHALQAVRDDIVPPRSWAIRQFWKRFPAGMIAEVTRRVDDAPLEIAVSHVSGVPPDRIDRFVERLMKRVTEESLDESRRIALREWARETVRERGPNWRLGWTLLRTLSATPRDRA